MEDFDEIIRRYSEKLKEMGDTYGGEVQIETVENAFVSENEESLQETTTESQESENTVFDNETEEETIENEPSEDENAEFEAEEVNPPKVTFHEGEATSSADFFARVFTGESAYPVKDAKVVVYRGDNIYAFLETDGEGSTKRVKLPAFKESNSLDPDSENRSLEYLADVFASGFTAQKGLVVSAVGGSEIVLNVLLVPEEERLS